MDSIIDFLYPTAFNSKYTKIFLFSIGSYPHREESNHETPAIYQELLNKQQQNQEPFNNFEIYRVLIDPFYNHDEVMLDNVRKKFDNNTVIFNLKMTERDYYSLIDFANIISKFNCLSIIMEFTSIQRHHINNLSQYVYVTPNDCLGDTNNSLYQPIFVYDKKIKQYVFFNLENRYKLFDEYYQVANAKEFNFDKLVYIRELIKQNFKSIDDLYRKILNYMKVKEEAETCFDKNSDIYYISKNKLLHRLQGYTHKPAQSIIDEFEKSSFDNLENYIKNIIKKILYDCCYIENIDKSNGALGNFSIIIDTDNELYSYIKHFRTYFNIE